MSVIAENIRSIQEKLGNAKLIVVSKFRTIAEIQEAYDCGQRLFAENRVQALMERYDALPKDISWHLIGHLQTNKVKFIAPFISMIHSVDSEKLLQEIDKQGQKNGRIIPCLLQIYVAQEETKFGLTEAELLDLLESGVWRQLQHIQIRGLMAMASLTSDTAQIHREFANAKRIFDVVKLTHFADDKHFTELSLGMSSDFELALQHGSTMVRVGSLVFDDKD